MPPLPGPEPMLGVGGVVSFGGVPLVKVATTCGSRSIVTTQVLAVEPAQGESLDQPAKSGRRWASRSA